MSNPAETSCADHEERQLRETWNSPGGVVGWFMPVNQRIMGRRYIVTALIFFLLAGVLGLLIRIQLVQPQNQFLSPEIYNQIFTVHGTTMMFLFAIPVMEGFTIYVVPLMLGTRDMAFPRLNAFGYYVYLIGSICFFGSLFVGLAPAVGWFSYVPLAENLYSPGMGVGVWTTIITFIEVAALAAAVELIATIFRLRPPGMTLSRMPIFVWSALVMALMIVFAMPSIIVASTMLILDRILDMKFFVADMGGDPLLWQHLFWFFGHPEVYIILVPALGMISTIIETFTGRRIYGYTAIVVAILATGFVSFGLWVHHMFTTGLPELGASFFMVASAMLAIPNGVQVFCWLATLWGAKVRFATPMLWIFAFFGIFVLGGLTGVMVASVPFDRQVHDTYFVVAHFHYVLIGGGVLPVMAAFYYWYPKMTGRLMSEILGRWSCGLVFAGFNVTFFPMHILGLNGMPRRVYTYLEPMGWGEMNLVATVGAGVLALGFGMTAFNALWSLRHGKEAGDDPWGAGTLEWATNSPPAPYNHRHVPVVNHAMPLWDYRERGSKPVVAGLRSDRREVMVTSVLDAKPEAVVELPGPTLMPFLTALGASVGFIGLLVSPWFFVVGFFLVFFGAVAWLWPRRPWRD